MKTLYRFLALGTCLGLGSCAAWAFQLESTDIKNGSALPDKQVLNGFGCEGGNTSPQLAWHDVPEGTQSFVITLYDPDAPTGSGWWHWVLYNIPANVSAIAAGANVASDTLPKGAVEGLTDFGTRGFGGACPPAGAKPHHYVFRITALKTARLELPETATAAMVGFMAQANSLGSAELFATYGR